MRKGDQSIPRNIIEIGDKFNEMNAVLEARFCATDFERIVAAFLDDCVKNVRLFLFFLDVFKFLGNLFSSHLYAFVW